MTTHHENHRHDSGDNREPVRTGEVSGLQYRSGAFQAPSVRTKSPTVHSATPPKPPKGRFFVVGLVMSVLGFGAFNVWNSFFRYSAYGVVEGRTIEVPAPVTGVVRYVHVQNGDRVRQGQLLMSLDQLEIEQRLGRLSDELLMTQAKLDAEVSASQWRMAQYQIQFGEAAAEYRDKWAAVRADQVKLRRAQQRRERVQGMVAKEDGDRGRLGTSDRRRAISTRPAGDSVGRLGFVATAIASGRTGITGGVRCAAADVGSIEEPRKRTTSAS